MIALDTNVLVRFLIGDDKAQSAKAKKLFTRAVEEDEPLFVSDIVVCETVWVLHSSYRVPRAEVSRILGNLFIAAQLRFPDVDRLSRALEAFSSGKGDYADYLIREHARAQGCETVVTFDRALLKEKQFTALQ